MTSDYKEASAVARDMGIAEDVMVDLLEKGELPGVPLGNQWLVSVTRLVEYLQAEEKRQFEARRSVSRPNVGGGGRKRRQRRAVELEYVLLGDRRHEFNRINLLVNVLRALDERDPDFLRRFSRESGRTRKYVAASRADLYPGKERLSRFATELRPGWWVGTNYSAKEIEGILRKACRVAGLKWGMDLVVIDRGRPANKAKGLAFVGVAADTASDVARRHDEYFGETLTNGKP